METIVSIKELDPTGSVTGKILVFKCSNAVASDVVIEIEKNGKLIGSIVCKTNFLRQAIEGIHHAIL